jgi:hypothetical protein
MVINLTPPLEAAINEQAKRRGVDPEKLALDALQRCAGLNWVRGGWPLGEFGAIASITFVKRGSRMVKVA